MSSPPTRSLPRLAGARSVVLALLIAAAVGAVNVVPVRSQVPRLDARSTRAAISPDAPWSPAWDRAPSQQVPLSAQNITPPFGGGTVQAVTVRALYDAQQLYLLLEWADDKPDDAVNGVIEFSDAAAVMFPAVAASVLPPFTMGAAGSPVNIWQWKAVWESDIAGGFATSRTRYPNTVVDFYPNADDPIYRPATYVGNPLAQQDHASPIENLIAESFGTLTHADLQDVSGSGEWRDGHWRALFVRPLKAAEASEAGFDVGSTTNIAFAVWNGGAGDRDGVKSIAPWIELGIGTGATVSGFGGAQILIVAVIALALGAAAVVVFIGQRQRRGAV
ncbi:MAG: ethylbenzene dehydrogenase-related protein [Dehalococcoidia bacterium]